MVFMCLVMFWNEIGEDCWEEMCIWLCDELLEMVGVDLVFFEM